MTKRHALPVIRLPTVRFIVTRHSFRVRTGQHNVAPSVQRGHPDQDQDRGAEGAEVGELVDGWVEIELHATEEFHPEYGVQVDDECQQNRNVGY